MNVPETPEVDLSLPDAALGEMLWTWWRNAVYAKASEEQASDTVAMEDCVRLEALTLDLDGPGEAVLEKAIRLATLAHLGNGDDVSLTRAGRHLRFYLGQNGVLAAALDEAKSGRRKQRAIASRDRPKKQATARSETIAAMTVARRSGQTLGQFFDAAAAGSITGLTIKKKAVKGVDRWAVDCDKAESKDVSESTFSTWWASAHIMN